MDDEKSKGVTGCPFFLVEIKTCRLFSTGFYLPSKENVTAYCLTTDYPKCSMYYRHCRIEKNAGSAAVDGYGNRRRFRRIPGQRKAVICSCDPEGKVVGDFSEEVLTVDYSQRGMRIIANKKIPANTLLLFNFNQDFVIPELQGVAQLRWQRNLENMPYSTEAGLLFKDDGSQKALARAIELGGNLN